PLSRDPSGWGRLSSLAPKQLPRLVRATRRRRRPPPSIRAGLPDDRRRVAHRRRERRAGKAHRTRSRADDRVRLRKRATGTLRAMIEAAREWADRLGAVGVWTHDVERMSAASARDYVRAIESLGFAALWIPESLGSKEAFAHASLLLGEIGRAHV